MSHVHDGPLATYNSLLDSNLAGYFSNNSIRRHLKRAKLVNKRGEVINESKYRLLNARAEHRKQVREMLAQAIVNKSLDVERTRQSRIKCRLDDIAKIELVKRVKAERKFGYEDTILDLLRPTDGRTKRPSSKERSRSALPQLGSFRTQSATSSPPATSRPENLSARSYASQHNSRGASVNSSYHYNSKTGSRKNRRKSIDSTTSFSSGISDESQRDGHRARPRPQSGTSDPPPQLEREKISRPPLTWKPNPPPQRPGKDTPRDQHGRPLQTKSHVRGRVILHRQEPAFKHEKEYQTFAEVKLKYLGGGRAPQMLQEVVVEQQHCGGNTLTVFKAQLKCKSFFSFTSKRHRGYPFGLTLYIDGKQDATVSTCCEYKHKAGALLGSKTSHFLFLGVKGSKPCYKCELEADISSKMVKNKNKKTRKQERPIDLEDDASEADEVLYQEDFEVETDKIPVVTDDKEPDSAESYESDFDGGSSKHSDDEIDETPRDIRSYEDELEPKSVSSNGSKPGLQIAVDESDDETDRKQTEPRRSDNKGSFDDDNDVDDDVNGDGDGDGGGGGGSSVSSVKSAASRQRSSSVQSTHSEKSSSSVRSATSTNSIHSETSASSVQTTASLKSAASVKSAVSLQSATPVKGTDLVKNVQPSKSVESVRSEESDRTSSSAKSDRSVKSVSSENSSSSNTSSVASRNNSTTGSSSSDIPPEEELEDNRTKISTNTITATAEIGNSTATRETAYSSSVTELMKQESWSCIFMGSNIRVNDTLAIELKEFCSALRLSDDLKTLQLDNCDSDKIQQIAGALGENISCARDLRLSICNSKIGISGCLSLCSLIKKFNVQSIKVSNCDVTDLGAAELVKCLRHTEQSNLTTLHLKRCQLSSGDTYKELAMLVKTTPLTDLSLAGNHLTEAAVEELAAFTGQLSAAFIKRLDMSDMALGMALTDKPFVKWFNKASLHYINLEENSLSDSQLFKLFELYDTSNSTRIETRLETGNMLSSEALMKLDTLLRGEVWKSEESETATDSSSELGSSEKSSEVNVRLSAIQDKSQTTPGLLVTKPPLPPPLPPPAAPRKAEDTSESKKAQQADDESDTSSGSDEESSDNVSTATPDSSRPTSPANHKPDSRNQ